MGRALYRTYRSRKLSEIVGQEHVTSLLENALKSDRIAHAYLFTGPRGVGKTSIARILAHEINQLEYTDESQHIDIIEIDAASNNGVDDIRDLREKVSLAPTSAKKKVYIIDEVHMLSKQAFNALLKTLEEPPEHVVFILATTDADKIPETILSRTQRHSFRRASEENIIKNLKRIAKIEKITTDDEALKLIAMHADGSYRDSLSLLDQLANITENKTISIQMVEDSLGLAPQDAIMMLAQSAAHKQFDDVIQQLKSLEERGIQPSIIATQLIRYIISSVDISAQLLSLVTPLSEVPQSSAPQASLIACLGIYSSPTKTVPTQVASPEVIAELAIKATEPHPKDDIVSPKTTNTPSKRRRSTSSSLPDTKMAESPARSVQSNRAIDWKKLTESAKTASIGLSSVLTKCQGVAHDSTFTIYTRNEFYRKKLLTSAYQKILHQLLSEQSAEDWEIILVPGSAPTNNEQIDAVTAIMGGGEEVQL